MNQKHRGAHCELLACQHLLSLGYEVFRNVSAHGPADLVAVKAGETILIDVKCVTNITKFTNQTIKITKEQAALGVCLLLINGDELTLVRQPPIRL